MVYVVCNKDFEAGVVFHFISFRMRKHAMHDDDDMRDMGAHAILIDIE